MSRSSLSFALGVKFKNQPLAMLPAHAVALHRAIAAGAFDVPVFSSPGASKFIGTRDVTSRWRVTADGIALVPVSGLLVDRGDWLGDLGGWATSYEGLAEQFRRLAKDSAIKAVVLDIDSGGGMVAGLWDACAELGKLKKAKKVYAVAANLAASAAYAIGCTTHEFYVSRAGTAGSVGVISIHQSYARALDGAGIDTTIIAAGEHKADGNPFTPLSHGARSELCREIDDTYSQFVAHVSTQRRISERAVRDLEARCFTGKGAVTAGLADGVKCVSEVVEHIANPSRSEPARPSSRRRSPGDEVAFAIGFGVGLATNTGGNKL